MWHNFAGKLIVFGCGAVSSCFLDILKLHFQWPANRLVLVDKEPLQSTFEHWVKAGAKFFQRKLLPDTLEETAKALVQTGDFVLDLTVNVDTVHFLKICQSLGVHYTNAALEQWVETRNEKGSVAAETLYSRHIDLANAGLSPTATTALLDSGANPGIVSHLVKAALLTLAKEQGVDFTGISFAALAKQLGVQTIHISEKDTQDGLFSRDPGEFQNTWSVEGLLEEARAPAEMGWGTSEPFLPAIGHIPKRGPQNQIFLDTPGCSTRVQSWVPSGPIQGFVIRHGEAFTLSRFLTHNEGEEVVYRPTVHYAYCLCRAAQESLAEWKQNNFKRPAKQTILTHHLDGGRDELGVLLLGESFGARWCGSLLDLKEAQRIVPGHNATTVQVAAGLLCGIEGVLREPSRGVLVPEDLDHVRALEVAIPFLGPVVWLKADWLPPVKPGLEGNRWTFSNLSIEE